MSKFPAKAKKPVAQIRRIQWVNVSARHKGIVESL